MSSENLQGLNQKLVELKEWQNERQKKLREFQHTKKKLLDSEHHTAFNSLNIQLCE